MECLMMYFSANQTVDLHMLCRQAVNLNLDTFLSYCLRRKSQKQIQSKIRSFVDVPNHPLSNQYYHRRYNSIVKNKTSRKILCIKSIKMKMNRLPNPILLKTGIHGGTPKSIKIIPFLLQAMKNISI